MGGNCGKEACNHDTDDSRIKLVKCFSNFVPKMVLVALEDAFNKLNDSDAIVHAPSETPKSKKKVNKATLIFEFKSFTSELKNSFQETLFSLDLFDKYCDWPNEQTAKPLQLLFNRGKTACKEIFSTLPSIININIQNYFNVEEPFTADLKKPKTENSKESEHEEEKQHDSAEIGDHEKKHRELFKYINESSWKVLSSKAEISDEHDSICQSLVKRRSKEVGVRKIPDYLRVEAEEIDMLICEIKYLNKQVELLKIENQEILAEMGEIIVEKNVKESDDKKSANIQRIYRSSSPDSQRSGVPTCCTKPATEVNRLGYPNDSHGHGGSSSTIFDKIRDRPENVMVVSTDSSNEQPILGAIALVPANYHENLTTKNDSDTVISRSTNSETHKVGVQISSMTSDGDGGDKSGRVYDNLSFSVQQDYVNGGEFISLSNVPSTSVAKILYHNYKMLLLSLGKMLLSADVIELKNWANNNFSVTNAQNATDVLLQLDEKEIINASNLSSLRVFFESIGRIDLVHIIDTFLLGDYSLLHQTAFPTKRDGNNARNPQRPVRTTYSSFLTESSRSSGVATRNQPSGGSTCSDTNAANSAKEGNSVSPQSSVVPNFSASKGNSRHVSKFPNENQSTSDEQHNLKPVTNAVTQFSAGVVTDSPVINERRAMTSNPQNTFGSNGLKQSKYQRPGSGTVSHSSNDSRNQDLEDDGNWLCSHYKRRCLVKFECCDKFWPCHRCHNNQSSCGRKKLKSRDTQLVKCVSCQKVQQFGQFCCQCGAKFANYFCGLCQHLTGNDDHPYHCQKCGICRIHGDRSFHCDVCGVCLDVQLLGNHKCREGSAHDECCICLEDAFTGCQILPCSHKVHKECATQMIRSGITRCPICRESFAHKLERRPLSNSRKRGK